MITRRLNPTPKYQELIAFTGHAASQKRIIIARKRLTSNWLPRRDSYRSSDDPNFSGANVKIRPNLLNRGYWNEISSLVSLSSYIISSFAKLFRMIIALDYLSKRWNENLFCDVVFDKFLKITTWGWREIGLKNRKEHVIEINRS